MINFYLILKIFTISFRSTNVPFSFILKFSTIFRKIFKHDFSGLIPLTVSKTIFLDVLLNCQFCKDNILLGIFFTNNLLIHKKAISSIACLHYIFLFPEYCAAMILFILLPVLCYIKGILPKGPYLPCVSMAGRALLAGYHWYVAYQFQNVQTQPNFFTWLWCHFFKRKSCQTLVPMVIKGALKVTQVVQLNEVYHKTSFFTCCFSYHEATVVPCWYFSLPCWPSCWRGIAQTLGLSQVLMKSTLGK